MRNLVAALCIAMLVALAMPVSAQPTEFGFEEQYLARIGSGDIAITAVVEPEGWNIAEYLRFTHDGLESSIALGGAPATIIDASCDCGNITVDGARMLIGSDVPAGDHVVRLVRNFPAADSFDASLAIHGGQAGRLVAYVPNGYGVLTDAALRSTGLNCTDAPCMIEEYTLAGNAQFLIVPASVIPAGPMDDDGDGVMAEYGLALLGLLLGAAIWAYLVQKGLVQKRRAQEKKVAAHVEAAQAEAKDTLTARKRVLMAGLKELEKAKMGKEIDTDTYDQLKAELKKETVTVMRALETAE